MTAKVLYHPRIFTGCAAELERSREAENGPRIYVSCIDCRHAVRYDTDRSACWCGCYKTERSVFKPRECQGFEART